MISIMFSQTALKNIRKDIVAFYDFEQDIDHTKETNPYPNIHERKASILNQIDLMSRDLLTNGQDS
jgi:hypothetical protein